MQTVFEITIRLAIVSYKMYAQKKKFVLSRLNAEIDIAVTPACLLFWSA